MMQICLIDKLLNAGDPTCLKPTRNLA